MYVYVLIQQCILFAARRAVHSGVILTSNFCYKKPWAFYESSKKFLEQYWSNEIIKIILRIYTFKTRDIFVRFWIQWKNEIILETAHFTQRNLPKFAVGRNDFCAIKSSIRPQNLCMSARANKNRAPARICPFKSYAFLVRYNNECKGTI